MIPTLLVSACRMIINKVFFEYKVMQINELFATRMLGKYISYNQIAYDKHAIPEAFIQEYGLPFGELARDAIVNIIQSPEDMEEFISLLQNQYRHDNNQYRDVNNYIHNNYIPLFHPQYNKYIAPAKITSAIFDMMYYIAEAKTLNIFVTTTYNTNVILGLLKIQKSYNFNFYKSELTKTMISKYHMNIIYYVGDKANGYIELEKDFIKFVMDDNNVTQDTLLAAIKLIKTDSISKLGPIFTYIMNKPIAEIIEILKYIDFDFSLLGDYTEILIIDHGFEVIELLKDTNADFSMIQAHDINSFIRKHGLSPKDIELLKDINADFRLVTFLLHHFIKEDGLKVIELLKDTNANFSYVDGSTIYFLIKEWGLEVIDSLKDTNADFSFSRTGVLRANDMLTYKLFALINDYGLEFIKLLKDTNFSFKGVLKEDLYKIINEYGLEVINLLKDADLNLIQEYYLQEHGLKAIELLKDTDASFNRLSEVEVYIIIKEHGLKAIELLRDTDASFNELSVIYLYKIINEYGLEAIKLLKDTDASFNESSAIYLYKIINEHGLEAIKLLKDTDASFDKLLGVEILEIINEHGLEVIKLLKDKDGVFNELPGRYLYKIIKHHGLEAIKLLKYTDASFNELSGSNLYEILKKYGLEAIKLLKDTDVSFNSLLGIEIFEIINEHGLEAIKLLKDTDANELSEMYLYKIIKDHGLEAIELLEDTNADLSSIKVYYYNELITENGFKAIELLKNTNEKSSLITGWNLYKMIEEHGFKAIESLKDTNANFSLLTGWNFYEIINDYGLKVIESLKDTSSRFNELSGSNLYEILKKYGLEAIKLLKDNDADFHSLKPLQIGAIVAKHGAESMELLRDLQAGGEGVLDSNKVKLIKDLCEPIGDQASKVISDQLLEWEELGLFQKFISISNDISSDFRDIIDNAPMTIESFEDILSDAFDSIENITFFNVDVFSVSINNTEVQSIAIDKDNAHSYAHEYSVSQGVLIHPSKVISCEHIFLPKLYSLLDQQLNKYGYSFQFKGKFDQEYNDTELELMYLDLNFKTPIYGNHDSCQDYALSLGDLADEAMGNCPEHIVYNKVLGDSPTFI